MLSRPLEQGIKSSRIVNGPSPLPAVLKQVPRVSYFVYKTRTYIKELFTACHV